MDLSLYRCTVSYPAFNSGHSALRLKVSSNIFSSENIQNYVCFSAVGYDYGDAAGSRDFGGLDFALDSAPAQFTFTVKGVFQFSGDGIDCFDKFGSWLRGVRCV